MAKKRASGKPKVDITADEYVRQLKERTQAQQVQKAYRDTVNTARQQANTRAWRSDRMENIERLAQRQERRVRVATRNMNDISRNLATRSGGAIPMGPAKGDKLSGRTVEAGTRSLREGMRSWMRDLRGGGGSRLTGR